MLHVEMAMIHWHCLNWQLMHHAGVVSMDLTFKAWHLRALRLYWMNQLTNMRLVAFNLGYLPGGDKTVITRSATTLLALQAASRMLDSGGLISLVVYVGHPGGRDELETVESFASSLSMESWVSSKLEMLNRPTCPVLVFFFKRQYIKMFMLRSSEMVDLVCCVVSFIFCLSLQCISLAYLCYLYMQFCIFIL